jgi:hypothetical protein
MLAKTALLIQWSGIGPRHWAKQEFRLPDCLERFQFALGAVTKASLGGKVTVNKG